MNTKEPSNEWNLKKHFKNVWIQVSNDFTHPIFLLLLFLLLFFVVWGGYIQKNNRIKQAAHIAAVTFIIAYFSRLDLVFTAAFVVSGLYLLGFQKCIP